MKTLFCHSGLDPESSHFNIFLDTGFRRYDDYWTSDKSINYHDFIGETPIPKA